MVLIVGRVGHAMQMITISRLPIRDGEMPIKASIVPRTDVCSNTIASVRSKLKLKLD